jgi:hypothetical protein
MSQDPADVYPVYLKAFNAGDIDATVACYESQACFISKSGPAAHGTLELRMASNKRVSRLRHNLFVTRIKRCAA